MKYEIKLFIILLDVRCIDQSSHYWYNFKKNAVCDDCCVDIMLFSIKDYKLDLASLQAS